jgi:membrane-bound lytic murein transglycosylase C
MKSSKRATVLITLAIMISSSSVLMADPFDDLEKETAQLKAVKKKVSSPQVSASSRCLRDTNVPEPVPAEELSGADRYEAWGGKLNARQKAWNKKLLEKYAQYKGIVTEEQLAFCTELEAHWDDPVTSNKKEWVEYSKDLKQRSRVDFEKEEIQIEVVVDNGGKLDRDYMRKALTTLVKKDRAQAFADDQVATAIEDRSKKEVGTEFLKTAPIKAEPLLTAFLTGKNDTTDQEIDEIIAHMMGSDYVFNRVVNSKGKTVHSITVPLTAPKSVVAKTPPAKGGRPSQLSRKASTVWSHVDRFADTQKISKALVLAVIETESAFNPQAKSGVPAYGLMQIVPGSAGVDATQELDGKGRILAPSYLYDSENNIEIGSTYLHILLYRYLKGVKDPLSRLYCSIAAYNTGAGNVSRAFIGKTRIRNAFPVINKLTPQQVYDHLLEKLPHDETKHYLERVSKRIHKYEALGV